jgi:hypothetical protein
MTLENCIAITWICTATGKKCQKGMSAHTLIIIYHKTIKLDPLFIVKHDNCHSHTSLAGNQLASRITLSKSMSTREW